LQDLERTDLVEVPAPARREPEYIHVCPKASIRWLDG
jgi:hypothetical protein